ncbi:MAG TPA: carbamoyltransferase C-terminal domain-containing protein [Arenibaculum sp.]|nr:carbamoyltransferase C-terminal domain-containing protein [Arenibaculum sp.]
MRILALHPGAHDASACAFEDYEVRAAVQLERLTRRKGDGGIPIPAMEEVLDVAGWPRGGVDAVVLTRGAFPFRYFADADPDEIAERRTRGKAFVQMAGHLRRHGHADTARAFRPDLFLADLGLPPDTPLSFAPHHESHALPALFYTDWDDALVYTADGGGDGVHFSQWHLSGGAIENLYGDDRFLLAPKRVDAIGLAYGYATEALGFRMNRHEGKLTGLAAFGEPVLLDALARHWRVGPDGHVTSDFPGDGSMRAEIGHLADGVEPADVAASIQRLLEDLVLTSVRCFLRRTGARRLGLAGGVFANVRLNRLLFEQAGVDEAFVFPAMGDEGLSIGAALGHLLRRDGAGTWLRKRRRLNDVLFGRAPPPGALDGIAGLLRLPGDPAETAARLLAEGRVVAILDGRTEFGPRALGARSILASPAGHGINDTLNRRLSRTDFMPFAPCVLPEDAGTVFEVTPANAYACRFMTVTCAFRQAWRERIPAVVHVDGTARPQIVNPEATPLQAGILRRFKAATGLPVLVNTSFNVHEEPIVNRAAEAVDALRAGRVDFLVTSSGVYKTKG